MIRDLRLFIAGFGVVGQALATRLIAQREEVKFREWLNIQVVGITDSTSYIAVASGSEEGLDLSEVLSAKRQRGIVGVRGTPDLPELLSSTSANVFVELAPAGSPDGEPGLSHIRGALRQGTHVITANKMPLALRYAELVNEANRRQLALRYGACVGGGVPVLEFGDACANSETITRIDGVLNATSNFVLTEMERENASFQEALSKARRGGYAEADPSFDIDGVDTACKIVLLANHVLETTLSLGDVEKKEGIRGVSLRAVKGARRRGKKIRMVASFEKRPTVCLTELDEGDPLALDGPNNAVRFRCRDSGERVVSGNAGGGQSTSSAVLRDIIWVGMSGVGGEGRSARKVGKREGKGK